MSPLPSHCSILRYSHSIKISLNWECKTWVLSLSHTNLVVLSRWLTFQSFNSLIWIHSNVYFQQCESGMLCLKCVWAERGGESWGTWALSMMCECTASVTPSSRWGWARDGEGDGEQHSAEGSESGVQVSAQSFSHHVAAGKWLNVNGSSEWNYWCLFRKLVRNKWDLSDTWTHMRAYYVKTSYYHQSHTP